MYINKNFNFRSMAQTGAVHLVWMTGWSALVLFLYANLELTWISIPWTAVGLVGTAVSFYVGFKNNQAYERLWEARKIWGGLVNSSRMWGTNLRAYVTNQFTDGSVSQEKIDSIVKKLIYRHISYLYALRGQLLVTMPWEHTRLKEYIASLYKKGVKKTFIWVLEDRHTKNTLEKHLEDHEHKKLKSYANAATQIIDLQSQDLMQLRKENIIDDFRQITLQNLLNEFLADQGKAERIKRFPLPRQYSSASRFFVGIFIFLLPFGLIADFVKLGTPGLWFFIPVVTIISWIFLIMLLVGDFTENPFEGLGNDIPMLSICRTIEIDLKEMIDDPEIPEPIKAVENILM